MARARKQREETWVVVGTDAKGEVVFLGPGFSYGRKVAWLSGWHRRAKGYRSYAGAVVALTNMARAPWRSESDRAVRNVTAVRVS